MMPVVVRQAFNLISKAEDGRNLLYQPDHERQPSTRPFHFLRLGEVELETLVDRLFLRIKRELR